ncbi:MAG: ribonuclease HII [Flavobacteriaceae bacterium]|nr:ribonuclease HII [Flavobacteriaceae bacterium]MDH3796246.1 ribonuclease HII [Flavobacteriaceae bacterium]
MLQPYFETPDEAGTDEAGRGCLAGPVTAAAVILPPDYSNAILNDSKQLTHSQRDKLAIEIRREAICYAVADIDPETIDQVNILKASIMGMHKALDKLEQIPSLILVDGNKFYSYKKIRHHCMIKGDGRFMSIAAASILAKTHRDSYMAKLHEEYPVYNWHRNKGYPTKEHRKAIALYGPTKYHRKSFRLLPEQLKLNL